MVMAAQPRPCTAGDSDEGGCTKCASTHARLHAHLTEHGCFQLHGWRAGLQWARDTARLSPAERWNWKLERGLKGPGGDSALPALSAGWAVLPHKHRSWEVPEEGAGLTP